jgi:hypothetical protein
LEGGTASIFRVEQHAKQVASKKQAASKVICEEKFVG